MQFANNATPLESLSCTPPKEAKALAPDGKPYTYRPFMGVSGCPPEGNCPGPKSYPSCVTLQTPCAWQNDQWNWTSSIDNCERGRFCDFSPSWSGKFSCEDGTCCPKEPRVGCQWPKYRVTYPGGSRELYEPFNIRAMPFRPVRKEGQDWDRRSWHRNRRISVFPDTRGGFDLTRYNQE